MTDRDDLAGDDLNRVKDHARDDDGTRVQTPKRDLMNLITWKIGGPGWYERTEMIADAIIAAGWKSPEQVDEILNREWEQR